MKVAALALCCFALMWPAAAHACGPKSGTTVSENRLARVYHLGPSYEPAYRACAKPHGRPFSFGADGIDDAPVEHVRLSGRRVFYAQRRFSRYFSPTVLEIRTLHIRSRRAERDWMFIGPDPAEYSAAVDNIDVRGVRFKRKGSTAFLVGPVARQGVSADEVWVADARGTRRVDRGVAIDEASFTFDTRYVRWRNGEALRRARLR